MLRRISRKGWLTTVAACAIAGVLALVIPGLQAAPAGQGELPRPGGASASMPKWFDVLHTQGGRMDFSRRPLAGSIFGPGFESFSGSMDLVGRPFGFKGPFELGTGDVALKRKGPGALPGTGRSTSFPALIAAVSWHSAQPIEVRSATGSEFFDVEVTLSQMARQPEGVMTLTRETAGGGTLSFRADAVLRFRFYQEDGTEVIFDSGRPGNSRGRLRFEASGIPWSVRCAGSTLQLPRLSGGICLGEAAGGVTPAWKLAAPSIELALEAAQPVAPAEEARVGVTALVAPAATLGAGVQVGEGARVSAGSGLGRGVRVDPDAVVAADALVGAYSRVGQKAYVGPGSYLGERVWVGRRVRLERDVVVHDRTVIGTRAVLKAGVVVGSRSEIGEGATVGEGAQVGIGSRIGARARIHAGITLAPGTSVPPGTVVTQTYYTCMLPGGISVSMTIDECTAAGGAIRGHVPPGPNDPDADGVSSFALKTQQVPQGQVGGAQRGQLGQDVDDSGVAPGNGGQPYTPETNDCDDFADDLEQSLEDQGWNATFTCIWKANEDHAWYNWLWTPELTDGHCLTDVHLEDGGYVWIEAQWTSGQGAVGQNLDTDGDGQVGVANGPGSGLTEGNTRVEVYGSAAEAEAAGRALD